MKTTLKIFLFLVVAFGFSATANAQTSASAGVTVMQTLNVAHTSDMSFGNIIPSASAGTVLMTTTGARTAADGVSLPNSTNGTPAAFTITGTSGASINISLSTATISLTGPGTAMTVTSLTSDPGTGTQTLTGGSIVLKVAGTLNVGANQTNGSYTGTFNVTAAYN